MKNWIWAFCLLIIGMIPFAVQADQKPVTEKIHVYGNCSMCKERIESALDVKGVKSAEWSPKTKQLEITYNPDKISLKQIHEIINKAGHDTEVSKAADAVYADLPGCCHYRERAHE